MLPLAPPTPRRPLGARAFSRIVQWHPVPGTSLLSSPPPPTPRPARLHENCCRPVRPGAGPFICACVSLSLRSHGDTLHAFPRDRPDPKTLDRGRPLRGGARPPGLSLPSHPPSD